MEAVEKVTLKQGEMKVDFQQHELTKRYPLRISRGETTGSVNLFVSVHAGGVTGIGEAAPDATAAAGTAALCQAEIERLLSDSREKLSNPHDAWQAARQAGISSCAFAAFDVALWDCMSRQAEMPLYRLLGLPRRAVPTSVTVGILPEDIARERTLEILERTGARYLKIKLGSQNGIDADKTMFAAVRESAAAFDVGLRVDANGGWNVSDAKHMMRWLQERGCDYVEQPLPVEANDALPELFAGRALPIFVDESVRVASDVPKLADRVDGVNLKLMKCGGITEALRIVATARALGLDTMIGCMGESSIAIAAGASIGALFDHIDLDSHLNLLPDPATGTTIIEGVVTVADTPGHGATLSC